MHSEKSSHIPHNHKFHEHLVLTGYLYLGGYLLLSSYNPSTVFHRTDYLKLMICSHIFGEKSTCQIPHQTHLPTNKNFCISNYIEKKLLAKKL